MDFSQSSYKRVKHRLIAILQLLVSAINSLKLNEFVSGFFFLTSIIVNRGKWL